MRKKSSAVGEQTHEAEATVPHVYDDVSAKRSRALTSRAKVQARTRAGGSIYIWHDADDGPGAPRSGTHMQYARRQAAGKARLAVIIKASDSKASFKKQERFTNPDFSKLFRGGVKQLRHSHNRLAAVTWL